MLKFRFFDAAFALSINIRQDKFFEQKIFPDFPVNSLYLHRRMTGVVSETSEPFAGFVFLRIIANYLDFIEELYRNLCNGKKCVFNQTDRICRERERELLFACFSSFFPQLWGKK